MRTGRPIPPLTITGDERDALERWPRHPTTGRALAQRARVILACATGKANTRVAHELGLTTQTVGKWRRRFLVGRLDGLLDEARPGTPRRVTEAHVEQMVTLTLRPPRGAGPWTSREIAALCGVSQSTVSRTWRAFGLRSHRSKARRLPKDALLAGKVRGRRRSLLMPARPG